MGSGQSSSQPVTSSSSSCTSQSSSPPSSSCTTLWLRIMSMSTKKIPMLSRVCQHLLPTSLMLPMMMVSTVTNKMLDMDTMLIPSITARFSTFATPCTTMMGSWTGWTSTVFVCGENTVFDQQTLTCNHPEDAFPCQESPSLYGAVEFGKIES